MTDKVVPVDTPFTRWILSVMQERNWMYKDIADAAGVTQAAVTGWLKGARPRASIVIQLAMGTDTPIDQLFGIVHLEDSVKKGRRARTIRSTM